jgi:DNA primase
MDKLTIADVLAHYGVDATNVHGVGWHSIRCPFHDDSTASASVNVGTNAFKCHACPVKGDAIGVVMAVEQKGYREACEWATEILGKSGAYVPQTIPGQREHRKPKRRKWRGLPD